MHMKNTRTIVSAVVLTFVAGGQIILAFLFYNANANTTLINAGWGVLWISAVFGWLPIFTFRKWGGTPKGKSYIHTTKLVDRGVYALVRHPQYLAGMLLASGLCLISQHWAVWVLGVMAVMIYYADILEEEKQSREKFGQEYKAYMQRVPRVNFVLGIIRLLRRS